MRNINGLSLVRTVATRPVPTRRVAINLEVCLTAEFSVVESGPDYSLDLLNRATPDLVDLK